MYAHKKIINGEVVYETLNEHATKTLSFFNKQDLTFFNLLNHTELVIPQEELNYYIEQMVLLHDIGKYNHLFQVQKMGVQDSYISGNSNHSLKGAVYYFNVMYHGITNLSITPKEKFKRYIIVYLLSYIISIHHSSFGNIENYTEALTRFEEVELNQMEELPNFQNNSLNFMKQLPTKFKAFNFFESTHGYLFLRYVRGILSTCDYLATSTFMEDETLTIKRITSEQVTNSLRNYHNSYHYNCLSMENPDAIQSIRNAYVSEVQNHYSDSLSIDYIEAPTGVGKTHLSLMYVLKHLTEGSKIIYCTQFNNVSEQSYNYYSDILSVDSDFRISLNNAITEIYFNEEQDSYPEAHMRYKMLEYDFSLISNQKLLNTLFGNSIDNAIAFCNLHNSIIVIDEMQNVNTKTWKMLVEVLNILKEVFHCQILIMSATLPRITELLNLESNELVRNRELIEHPLLRNRVEILDDLFTIRPTYSDASFEPIMDKVVNHLGKRQVIEFITKKDANSFYKYVKDSNINTTILRITGDTNSLERVKIINYLCEKDSEGNYVNTNFLLIATQVIEAGLDIDCEIGYKDVSTYDSEIQFMGRVNRNNMFEKGYVYLFNKSDEKWIYDDYKTIKITGNYLENVKQFNFDEYFNKIIEVLKTETSVYNSYLNKGSYDSISELVAIKDGSKTIYIIDDTYEDQSSEWYLNEYLRSMRGSGSYSEKAIKGSKYRRVISYFTKNMYVSDEKIYKIGKNPSERLIKMTQSEFEMLSDM